MFKTYAVVIEGGKEGEEGFSGFFPDLPGCIACGATIEDCFTDAHGALSLHLAGMIEDGDDIPPPTPLDQLAIDADTDVAAVQLIRVAVTGKTQRVNVTLDSTLLAAIDEVTTNRSAFLADAALAALNGRASVARQSGKRQVTGVRPGLVKGHPAVPGKTARRVAETE